MSDQHVVTDWKAYFAALGPSSPTTPEQLEAMRDKDPALVLLMDEAPGQLMTRLVLERGFEEALEAWEAAGKPRAWLTLGEVIWWCESSSLPVMGKVRSKG